MKTVRTFLLLLSVLFSAIPMMAQHEGICTNPDAPAQFPGGKKALHSWVNDHIVYPTDGFIPPTGRIILRLTVEADGSVSYSTPVKRSHYGELEYAATDCIALMPKWTPAMKEGKAVKSYVFLPFNFKKTDSAEIVRLQGGITKEKMAQLYAYEMSEVSDDDKASVGIVSQEEIFVDETAGRKASVKKNPEFPGGNSALSRWLSAKLRYPDNAMDNDAQGRILVQFKVETDGSVSDAEVMNNIFPELDREALRVVNSMPKWIPGTVDGVPTRTTFRLPITFALTPDNDEITIYTLDN